MNALKGLLKKTPSSKPGASGSAGGPVATTGPAAVAAAPAAAAASPSGGKDDAKVDIDSFDLLKVVGKGSFGKVMMVRKKDTGMIYAMKVLKKEAIVARNQVQHTRTERMILQEVKHPFTVHLNFAFQSPDKLYLVLDYKAGGELFFHLKKEGKFSEERARFYTAEILLALEHMHSMDIIYRDLKPENIVLDEKGHIAVTDFGLSKEAVSGDSPAYTFCGTPEYLAPEILKGRGHGKAVDWWSLGTLLYEMMTGLPPFYSQNLNVMYNKILTAELRFPSYISADAKDLLEKMLNRDPEKRLGSRGAQEIKSHPFFKSVDFDKLYNREIEPPYKPTLKHGNADTAHFDPVFTGEVPKDTPVTTSKLTQAKADFKGFTYTDESTISKAAKK